MRVVNRKRWRRTKGWALVGLFITALACMGGLEDATPPEPIPSPIGFVISITLAFLLMMNITKEMREEEAGATNKK